MSNARTMSIARRPTIFLLSLDFAPLARVRLRTRCYATMLLAALPVLAVLFVAGSSLGLAQQQSAAPVARGVQQSRSQPLDATRGADRAVIVRGGGFVQPPTGTTPGRPGRSRSGQFPVANPVVPVAARQPGAVDPPAANRVAPAPSPSDVAPSPSDVLTVRRLEPPLQSGVDHLLAYALQPIKIRIPAPPLPTEQELAADPSINPFAYIDADELKVRLEGQFDRRPIGVSLQRLIHVVFPADRYGAEIPNAGLFTDYEIKENWPEPVRTVLIRNRFGDQELSLGRPFRLLVPAGRDGGPTAGFDHYKCFVVLRSCLKRRIQCVDPDVTELPARLSAGGACMFCVPVAKLHDGTLTEITAPDTHLTFYSTTNIDARRTLEVQDQFRTYDLQQRTKVMVGVPTYKLSVFPPVPRRVTPTPVDDNQASRGGTSSARTAALESRATADSRATALVPRLTWIQRYFSSWGFASP